MQTRADYIKALEDGDFELVLADYSLPSFDGLSALKIVQETCPEVPFVLVSGVLGEERAIEALKSGATDYVLRQRLERLVPAVQRAMREAEKRIERKRAEERVKTLHRQQAAVAELGMRALAENDLEAVMDQAVTPVARTLGVEYCKVLELLPEGDELLLRAGVGWEEGLVGNATVGAGMDSQAGYTLLSSEPVIVEDLSTERRFSGPPLLHEYGVVSGMSVIIYGRDEPFGVLGTHTKNRRTFTEDDVNFLQAVSNVLCTAIERKKAEEALHGVREAERDRLARDLHDGALQDLTYSLAEAQFLQAISKEPELDNRLEQVIEALKRVGQDLRRAIYDLRLEGEQEQTLVEMLESLVELNRQRLPDSEIELCIEEGVVLPLASRNKVELLRIVQEALTNTWRHAQARHVRVAVGASGDKLWAEVSDDGCGFDASEVPAGMGTKGMRERACRLGGDLKIESKPGKGTKVCFEAALVREGEEAEEEVHIMLVEDHTSVRQAIASIFKGEPGLAVVKQAGTLAEAREMLDGSVDVTIVDLTLPDGYGGDLIKELHTASPHAMTLVLSATLEKAEMARALEAGAAGVLHKLVGIEEVVEAVRRLCAGESLLPSEDVVELPRFASSLRKQEYEARQSIAQLSLRERDVLEALAEGLERQEIAERLNISVHTEHNHMTSILTKLGVHSRVQVLAFALRYGIVKLGH